MQIPASVTFHEIAHSDAVEARIRERIAKLEKYDNRMTRCDVTVDTVHHHAVKKAIFRVRIDITVPGAEIAVSHDPKDPHTHEDIYRAIRDSFSVAERRLKDHKARRRGD